MYDRQSADHNQRDNQRKILMMHIYNDIIERNDGESENNIIRGGMIMLRVDFTFDKKIIEKNGYTMSNIYETNLVKKIFHVWQKGKSFLSALEKRKTIFLICGRLLCA